MSDIKRTASTILVRQSKQTQPLASPLHRDDKKVKKASELEPSIEAEEDSDNPIAGEDSEDSTEPTQQLDLTQHQDDEPMITDEDGPPAFTLANKWDAFQSITERMVDDWIHEAGPNILSVKLKRKMVLDTPAFQSPLKRKRSVPAAGVKVLTKLAKRFRSK